MVDRGDADYRVRYPGCQRLFSSAPSLFSFFCRRLAVALVAPAYAGGDRWCRREKPRAMRAAALRRLGADGAAAVPAWEEVDLAACTALGSSPAARCVVGRCVGWRRARWLAGSPEPNGLGGSRWGAVLRRAKRCGVYAGRSTCQRKKIGPVERWNPPRGVERFAPRRAASSAIARNVTQGSAGDGPWRTRGADRSRGVVRAHASAAGRFARVACGAWAAGTRRSARIRARVARDGASTARPLARIGPRAGAARNASSSCFRAHGVGADRSARSHAQGARYTRACSHAGALAPSRAPRAPRGEHHHGGARRPSP